MPSTVAEVMTREVVTIAPDASYKEAVATLVRHGVDALPVTDRGGRVVGIVSATDLTLKEERPGPLPGWLPWSRRRRERRKAAAVTVAECMTTPPVTTPPDAPLETAARLLHRRGIHHLPVVDRDGRLVGIVTRRDLLVAFLRPDEEIRRHVIAGVLDATLNLPIGNIDVDVTDGVVTLAGRVPLHSQAEEAAELVRALSGVVAVRSSLTWDADDLTTAPAPPWY